MSAARRSLPQQDWKCQSLLPLAQLALSRPGVMANRTHASFVLLWGSFLGDEGKHRDSVGLQSPQQDGDVFHYVSLTADVSFFFSPPLESHTVVYLRDILPVRLTQLSDL